MPVSPLLPLNSFSFIPDTFSGKTVGYASAPHWFNAGDWMIDHGTRRLFREFGISLVDYTGPETECDIIAWAGGGNMGYLYGIESGCAALRQQILDDNQNRPVVILPQSYSTIDTFAASCVFVRERDSLRLAPAGARLAPDLAFAYSSESLLPFARYSEGVFLRDDLESVFPNEEKNDPIAQCTSPEEYIALASCYQTVITDRLHFATAALLAHRHAVLLPNRYHKNRSMYETWLCDMGCEWKDRL
jgi:exopolysaccharide biosynthesis predicted pyruvyltransferase EpsI